MLNSYKFNTEKINGLVPTLLDVWVSGTLSDSEVLSSSISDSGVFNSTISDSISLVSSISDR